MSIWIEPLESRALCSAGSPGLLAELRAEAGAVSVPVGIVQRTVPGEITKVAKELNIFHLSTSATLVSSLRTAFQQDLATWKSDTATAKLLYARAINHVAADEKVVTVHPTNLAATSRLAADEMLLAQQATAAVTTLGSDTAILMNAVAIDVKAIDNAHLIDATLASDTAAITGTLTTEAGVQAAQTETIEMTGVPEYVAS